MIKNNKWITKFPDLSWKKCKMCDVWTRANSGLCGEHYIKLNFGAVRWRPIRKRRAEK